MAETRRRDSPVRFVALLRAINVGGRTAKMEALREQFEALGLTRVSTFIASGNVLFDTAPAAAAALEARIERRLHEALGYEVATFLRTADEMAAAASHDAFPGTGAGESGYPLYLAFTRDPVSADAEPALLAARSDVDDFHVFGREIYWACRTSMGQSRFSGAKLEKIIGMPATTRNITTVRKLAALMTSGSRETRGAS